MFCYQCEQTFRGQSCVEIGVCGKDDTIATLQDLLVHALKGVSMYAHRARQAGAADPEIDAFVVEALFATLTNVNFDPERLASLIDRTAIVRDQARRLYEGACQTKGIAPEMLAGPAVWLPAVSIEGLISRANRRSSPNGCLPRPGNSESPGINHLWHQRRGRLCTTCEESWRCRPCRLRDNSRDTRFPHLASPSVDQLVTMALRTGELNYRVMELLDKVNTESLGHPEPTRVRVHPRKGKAIVVSGHDLADLHALLKQTDGLGIQVYTHGEMLPGNGYPKLKAYKHLAGNYRGSVAGPGKGVC